MGDPPKQLLVGWSINQLLIDEAYGFAIQQMLNLFPPALLKNWNFIEQSNFLKGGYEQAVSLVPESAPPDLGSPLKVIDFLV
jgi:hypothetical protein